MKLELKHISCYLPYKLKGQLAHYDDVITGELYRIETGYTQENKKLDAWVVVADIEGLLEEFKPILRSLSDLTKEIEHNGEKFVPALVLWSVNIEEEKLFKLYGDIPFYWTTCLELDTKHLDWGTIQKLLEWHFDIFDLIDNGLAIPKT